MEGTGFLESRAHFPPDESRFAATTAVLDSIA